MAPSFLSYRVDRKSPSSYFFLPSISQHLFLYMYCTPSSPLFYFLLCYFSSPTLLYSFHTICYSTVPSPRDPIPYFFVSLFLCSYIPYILQRLPLLWVSSTPPCTLLLPLGTTPSFHYAPSPSPTSFVMVLLPLSFSLSSLDTSTSCVPSPHIQSISCYDLF